MATHDWFPEILGRLDAEATLVTLVTKGPHSHRGVAPGPLSSLASLSHTVEIYWATPHVPPSYVGPLGASPHLTSPDGGLFAQSDPTSQHVYMAIHTSTGYSPLHQAVNHGVHESHSLWPSRRTTSPSDHSCIVTWINRRPDPDIRRYS